MSYRQRVLNDSPVGFWEINSVAALTYSDNVITYNDINTSYNDPNEKYINDTSTNANSALQLGGSFVALQDVLPLVTNSSYDGQLSGAKFTSFSTLSISNPVNKYKMFYNGTESLSFSMEFWLSFDQNPAVTNNIITIKNSTGTVGQVYVNNDKIYFTIYGQNKASASALQYTTFKQVKSWDSQNHILVSYNNNQIKVSVNSMGSDTMTLSNNFVFSTPYSSSSTIRYELGPSPTTNNFVLNDLAFYDYVLSDNLIKSHMVWGTTDSSPQNYIKKTDGYLIDIKETENMFAFKRDFSDSRNYNEGLIDNLVIDRDGLTLKTIPSLTEEKRESTTVTRTNLLYNPSLEVSLANWSAGSPMLLSQSADIGFKGTYSLKTQAGDYLNDTNIAMTSISIPDSVALSGKTITISAYVYCQVDSPFVGQTISISDEASGGPTTVSYVNPTLSGGQWSKVSKTMTYPSNVTAGRTWVLRVNSNSPSLTNRINKFPDPGFESGATTYFGAYAGVGKTSAYSSSTDYAYTGTKSDKNLAGTGKGTGARYLSLVGGNSAAEALVPSKSMVFSQYVYCPVPISVFNYLDIYNSSSTYLSTITGDTTLVPANTWTKVYSKGTTPANASIPNMLLQESATTPFPFRENLSENPSFEVNLTGWGTIGASATVRSTAQFYSGTASLLVTSSGTTAMGPYHTTYAAGRFPVTAGQTYTWSMYVKDINTAVSYAARVEFYNSLTAGSNVGTIIGTTTPINSTGWTRVSVTAVAPVGSLGAIPTIYSTTTPTAGTQAYFDAAVFEQESVFNYVATGSFDISTTGWSVLTGPATLARTTAISYSGQASGVVTYTGTPADTRTLRYQYGATENLKAYLPNGQYTLSARIYGAASQGITAVYIQAESNSSPLALLTSNSSTNATLNGFWNVASNTFTVTSPGYVVINVGYVGTPVNGNAFYIDNVMLQTGASVTSFRNSEYFDGSTGGTFQRWTGTANASTSIDSPPVYIDAVSMEVADSYNATLNPCMARDLTGWHQNYSVTAPTLTRLTGLTDVPNKRITTAINVNSPADAARTWNFLMGKVEGANGFFVAGQTYTMSFYAKLNSGSSTGYNMWFSNGSSLNNPANGVSFTPTSTWQRFSNTFTATSNFDSDTEWHIDMSGTAATNVSFTGFMVEKSATLNTFADSSYFDGSTTGYAWKGTTNASPSYQVAPLYIDSTIAEEASSVNLINNSSFENNIIGWDVNRSIAGTIEQKAITSQYGNKALLITKDAGYCFGGTNVGGLIPITVYTLSAYIYSPTATTIRTVIRDNGGAEYSPATHSLTPYTWTRVTRTFTKSAVAGTVVRLDIGWEAADWPSGTIAYVNNVLLQPGSTANDYVNSEYFDGSTGGVSQSWTGTAHASTSKDILSYATSYIDTSAGDLSVYNNASAKFKNFSDYFRPNNFSIVGQINWIPNTGSSPAVIFGMDGINGDEWLYLAQSTDKKLTLYHHKASNVYPYGYTENIIAQISTAITSNATYNFGMAIDGSNVKLYVSSIGTAASTTMPSYSYTNMNLYFGNEYSSATTLPLSGSIDNISLIPKYQDPSTYTLYGQKDNTTITFNNSLAISQKGSWVYSIASSLLSKVVGSRITWDSATSDNSILSTNQNVTAQISLDKGTTWNKVTNGYPATHFADDSTIPYPNTMFKLNISTSDSSNAKQPRVDNAMIAMYKDLDILSDGAAFLLSPRMGSYTGDTYSIKKNFFNILARSSNFGIKIDKVANKNSVAIISPKVKTSAVQTVEFWFRYDGLTSTPAQIILDTKGITATLYFDSIGSLRQYGFGAVYVNGSIFTGVKNLVQGESYHIVCVYNLAHNAPMYLGGDIGLNNFSLATYGFITLYPSILSQADIQNRYLSYLSAASSQVNYTTDIATSSNIVGTIAELSGGSTVYNGGNPILSYTRPTNVTL
jgi:hypothetical protein